MSRLALQGLSVVTRISNLGNWRWRGLSRGGFPARATVLVWLLGVADLPLVAQGDVPALSLNAWLTNTHLPAVVQNALRARLAADPQAHEWLVAQDQYVYALAYKPFSPSAHTQVQQAFRAVAEMQSRQLLTLYATGNYYQPQGFSNREAITKALTTLDTTTRGQLLPGLQSSATVLDQGAVALVWIEEDRIVSYRQHLPTVDQFRPAYCKALYPTAKALFQEGKHPQALAIYQDMHTLHCRQPVAYFLDAAECFLAIKQPQDARRMANYLLTEHASSLDSEESERAGDLLMAAGDDENARKSYELALSKRHEGH